MERWQKPEAENPCSAHNDDRPSRSSLDYSTPLRSVRGAATTSPSPFYKLSSELSRESLRLPGAVPFMWEQSPGRRKISTSTPPLVQAKPALPYVSTRLDGTDLTKSSLANLFQQPSLEINQCQGAVAVVSPSAVESQLPQIAQPPAMERPRSSSARYSTVPRNIPASPITAKSAFHDEFADAASESASDAISATAGGGSVDDSIMVSGPLRPTGTPTEARDFIMHRFLPAAHTIACESPHTPSRHFLPLGISAGPTPATPSRCNGSFRDYGGVTCTESSLVSGPKCKTTNSLLYASPSSLPPLRRQFLEGSFHSAIDDVVDGSEEEEEEEEPPFTPKACGFFPFRIHISIQTRRSTNRSSSFSKHHQHKNQQLHKKNSKATSCSHAPKRIMDVLREDQSSSYEDESPVRQHQSTNLVAERERNRIAVLKQTAMHSCSDPCPRPLYSSDRYYKESPQLHQIGAMQRSLSDLNSEEASEYGSFYDATSRFCSPSPVALHLVNARTLRTNMLSSLTATPQSTTSSVGLIDGNPHSALICTTEQNLLNGSLCYYNMHTAHNSLHSYHPQLASPCSCLTPPPSHVSSSQDSSTNHDITKVINTDWDAFSRIHHPEQRTHIISNALYEHEDQEINSSSDTSRPSMLTSCVTPTSNGTKINRGSETQGEDAKWHACTSGDYASKCAENSIESDDHIRRNGSHGDQYVSNGDGGPHEHKGDKQYVNDGDIHACDGMHYAYNHIHCVGNGGVHVCHGAHYVCNGNHAGAGARNTINGEKNGDVHEAKMGINGFSSSLLAPPLPKSPTHSWLGRAMPLVTSAANNSPNRSSRFSHLHNKPTILAAAEYGPQLKDKQDAPPPAAAAAAADSKWEALVKGSHLQPGHLRFSKELFHQSQAIVSGVS